MSNSGQLIRVTIATIVITSVMSAVNSFAIANWARKYSVDCTTCHSPAVPRLNAFGHEFRKMGFRMDTEIQAGKPEAYKELGNFASLRFRTGYRVESFSDRQSGGSGFNSYRTKNGFLRPDVTLFYAGALTKHLSLFTEIEFEDVDDVVLQVYGAWFAGNPEHYAVVRLGQMHTLSRVGWGGFDRPTGISTPDARNSRSLTTSPVPFRVGEDQRGLDIAYNFTPASRIIAGVYNGVDQGGHGNEGAGNDSGDIDNNKDVLLAFEQMLGESGFTLFGYYGIWDQKAGGAIPDDNDATEFSYVRLGATASWVFKLFDPKRIGLSEIQGGYIFAKDWYPDEYPLTLNPTGDDRDGHAWWVGVEQWLPHNSAVFYRYDQVSRSHETAGGARRRHTLGAVTTIEDYLRLAIEGFIYDQSFDSYGVVLQAMFNW